MSGILIKFSGLLDDIVLILGFRNLEIVRVKQWEESQLKKYRIDQQLDNLGNRQPGGFQLL